ncbi:stalk domain-containing protein [Paenibacillus thailandensis]|uniref:Stalk domain-containing protein n=1 Tax=Paenibacillus thailandensis TaxID=393250 RepID=A0ABW5QXF8_9BACL
MKLWKKPVTIVAATAVVASSVLLANTSFAADATKKLSAVYSNIVIKYNGSQVSTDASTEPFMVNGTTFVPVRLIGEATGNQVLWDQTNKTINITGTSKTAVDNMTKQLAEANAQIAIKDAEIAKLKSQLNAAIEDKATDDIDDVESDIQDEYEDYEDTDASITVTGDEDDVSVTIKVDADGWDDLSDSKKKSYLQDIVDDILDAFEDADVSGTVKDKDNSSKLASFETDSNGNVDLENTASDLSDLEDNLNDDYGDYEDMNFEIELSGDEDDITIEVYVSEAEWNNLSASKREDLEDDLVSDVEDEFPDADIKGYFYSTDDDSRLGTF